MVSVIETGIKPMKQPFSWAVKGGGVVFTAHGPVNASGELEGGDIVAQARLTFANLRQTVAAAGAKMEDVAQVLIYMKEASHMPSIDNVYREFFREPWPNRSSVVVKDFVHPAMLIEIVAYVVLPDGR